MSLAIFAAAWIANSWILLIVALFVLYEAAAGWCALYQFLGKNTCKYSKKR